MLIARVRNLVRFSLLLTDVNLRGEVFTYLAWSGVWFGLSRLPCVRGKSDLL